MRGEPGSYLGLVVITCMSFINNDIIIIYAGTNVLVRRGSLLRGVEGIKSCPPSSISSSSKSPSSSSSGTMIASWYSKILRSIMLPWCLHFLDLYPALSFAPCFHCLPGVPSAPTHKILDSAYSFRASHSVYFFPPICQPSSPIARTLMCFSTMLSIAMFGISGCDFERLVRHMGHPLFFWLYNE